MSEFRAVRSNGLLRLRNLLRPGPRSEQTKRQAGATPRDTSHSEGGSGPKGSARSYLRQPGSRLALLLLEGVA